VDPEQLREGAAEIVSDHLSRIPELFGELIAGKIAVF
jgi:hypothetical protein